MFTINAEVRNEQGKGASRRLRTANKFPAIIYGGNEAPLAVALDHDKVMNMQVKAQDVQRHPYKPKLLHIDFVRA